MDLWIRSQDRKNLVEIDGRLSITRVPTEKYNVEDGYRIEHFSFLLGIYKTEERALEVLDEIQELIKPTIINTQYQCEIEDTKKTGFDLIMNPVKTEIRELSTIVYTMPKE